MKKFIFFCVMCLVALTMNAQRCAVLEFKAGVGISQADVDGISAIFITYFRPAGYTMVERTQIDKAIDEQGFQRSRMTESQMVRIGQILNVSKIVIGDVNVVMGQYNVDARVINVESGTIAATEGATFDGSSYRTTMQSLAQKLASKIAITSSSSIQQSSSGQSKKDLAKSFGLEYIDLELPSKTLWADTHKEWQTNCYFDPEYKYTVNWIHSEFHSDMMPSEAQYFELYHNCERLLEGNKCTFIGKNGNRISFDMGESTTCENTCYFMTDQDQCVWFDNKGIHLCGAGVICEKRCIAHIFCVK